MSCKIKQATIKELKNGFMYNIQTKMFTCLFCATQYEDGDIYSIGNRLVCAEKAMVRHISEKHGFVFDNLLSTDKAKTGLTDTQKDFLRNYYTGISDKEIAEKMNISASTVRFQRYNFREKVKQAKIILALHELFEEKEKILGVSSTPVEENDERLETFFVSVSPLVLKTFSVKEKNKIFILETILQQFEKGKKYTEKELNNILKQIYDEDYVSIRRSLIDYGMMAREGGGKEYWVK